MGRPMDRSRAFRAIGMRNGSQVSVTWREGRLDGDPPTVDLVRVETELARINAGDTIHYDDELIRLLSLARDDPLADPTFAFHVVSRVLDTVRQVQADPSDLLGTLYPSLDPPRRATLAS